MWGWPYKPTYESIGGPNGHVLGMDISEDIINTCNRKIKLHTSNLRFVVGDLYDSSLDESSFDFYILDFYSNIYLIP